MLNAREAYRALGGTDAEWIGRSIPMGPRIDAGAEEESVATATTVAEDEGVRRFLAGAAG